MEQPVEEAGGRVGQHDRRLTAAGQQETLVAERLAEVGERRLPAARAARTAVLGSSGAPRRASTTSTSTSQDGECQTRPP
ncbi:hypothetical protein [Micromonospora sp. CA-248212]|uniref:hypothetical protein n=1 Tax=Micromonospora sp. CA-248212 TaxID=3239961 RepID=UPI003D8C2844